MALAWSATVTGLGSLCESPGGLVAGLVAGWSQNGPDGAAQVGHDQVGGFGSGVESASCAEGEPETGFVDEFGDRCCEEARAGCGGDEVEVAAGDRGARGQVEQSRVCLGERFPGGGRGLFGLEGKARPPANRVGEPWCHAYDAAEPVQAVRPLGYSVRGRRVEGRATSVLSCAETHRRSSFHVLAGSSSWHLVACWLTT